VASTGEVRSRFAETVPDIIVVRLLLNWLYSVIENVITAATVANITLPLLKKSTIAALVIFILGIMAENKLHKKINRLQRGISILQWKWIAGAT
jgi:uncharacterized membrane protein